MTSNFMIDYIWEGQVEVNMWGALHSLHDGLGSSVISLLPVLKLTHIMLQTIT